MCGLEDGVLHEQCADVQLLELLEEGTLFLGKEKRRKKRKKEKKKKEKEINAIKRETG